jgi:AcrR family transcriptional regulator
MARTTRKDARRRDVVAAAERAVSQYGVAEVKLKDVAEAAGMSPTSLLYYYDDGLDAILADVHRVAIERFLQRRESAVENFDSATEQLSELLRLGVPSIDEDHLVRTLYETTAFLQRHRYHALLAENFIERQIALFERVLAVGAARAEFTLAASPRELGRTFVALEDGLVLHVIVEGEHFDRSAALAVQAAYAGLVTGVPFDLADPG